MFGMQSEAAEEKTADLPDKPKLPEAGIYKKIFNDLAEKAA